MLRNGGRFTPEWVAGIGPESWPEWSGKRTYELFGFSNPIFRGKKDSYDKNGDIIPAFPGLQAADFLAYEVFQYMKTKDKSIYLWLLNQKIGEVQILTVKTIEQYNQFFNMIDNLDEFVETLRRNSNEYQEMMRVVGMSWEIFEKRNN